MAPDAQTPSPLFALRFKDFTLFQVARLLSVMGSNMVSVAVGWRVYALTGRPMDLAYVGLSQFLPFLIVAPLGGQVVDRLDRRWVLLGTYLSQALGAFWLGYTSLHGPGSLRPIYGVLALLGATRAFSAPAGSALISHLVPRFTLPSALSLGATVFQLATIIGPAAGGLLYRATGSTAPVFFGACGGAGCAFLLVLAMKVRTGSLERGALSWSSLVAGFRFVYESKLLLGCISLDLFAVLLGGAVALLPIFARDILSVGAEGLGLMRSAPAFGAAAMAIALARRPMRRHAGPKMLWAVLAFGVATIVFGLSKSFSLSLLMLATLGAADMVSVVVRMTVEQMLTPHHMRGRVSSVNQIFIGASNDLGEFESGAAAQLLGTVPAVIVGGVGTCLVVALWALVFPMLRKVDRLEDLKLPEGSEAAFSAAS